MTGELKEVAGQITVIDNERRTLAVTNKEGITTGLHWRQGHDPKMQKQKPHWFVRITYTIEGQDQNVVETCEYFQKPTDWPQNENQWSGKGKWQRDPLEGKRIAFNSLLNSAVATVTASDSVKSMKPSDIALAVLRLHVAYLQSLDLYLAGKVPAATLDEKTGLITIKGGTV
jgi:hypothetical protein